MLEQAKQELAAAAAADLTASSPAELSEEMREFRDLELGAVAQRLRRLEVFDRIGGFVDDGQVSSASWLRVALGVPHGAAKTEVSVARVRRSCPELSRIFDAGRTSFRHLQVVAVGMRRLPQPEMWTVLDERLTGWAQQYPVAEFASMVDELVEQLRPEPKPKDEKQRDRRRLSMTSGFDGMLNVNALLTPEDGEKFKAGISAASRPDVEGENRSPGQRNADALSNLLDVALDTGLLPVDGGEKPHINLLVPIDELAVDEQPEGPVRIGDLWNEPAAQRAQRAAAAAAMAEALDRHPRFSWTGATSSSTARRLACDGILLPVFTRGGQPIDVGRRTRVVSAAMRQLIVARDRHCQWKGCTLSARWCQVHHVRHWRDGGRTDRWNLILLCEAHHRAAHSGEFTLVLHAPGRISTRTRDVGDPYYEIRNPDPPPDGQPTLDGLLDLAVRHLRAS